MRLQGFLGIRPEIVAHDLHPEYLSRRSGHGSAPENDLPKVAVQHHHAHVASAMAEHGARGPGDYRAHGLGRDGLRDRRNGLGRRAAGWPRSRASSAWRRCVRCPWPGATRRSGRCGGSPWHALDDAFDGAPPLAALRPLPWDPRPGRGRCPADGRPGLPGAARPRRRAVLRRVRGDPRLGRPRSTYEGQVALEWNLVADDAEDRAYTASPSCGDRGPGPRSSLRPMVREAVADDLRRGRRADRSSARFPQHAWPTPLSAVH